MNDSKVDTENGVYVGKIEILQKGSLRGAKYSDINAVAAKEILELVKDDIIRQMDGDVEIEHINEDEHPDHDKHWTIEAYVVDGELQMTRTNKGFTATELLGICTFEMNRCDGEIYRMFGLGGISGIKHKRQYLESTNKEAQSENENT